MMRLLLHLFLTSSLLAIAFSCDLNRVMDRKVARSYKHDHYQEGTMKLDQGLTSLRYHVLGQGPDTAVLVHGFGPVAPQHWAHQVEMLKEDHVIVIPELVHFGHSTSSKEDFSPQYQAQMLSELLDSLHITGYHLGGVSYGGIVASLLAHRDIAKVRSLTIVDGVSKFLPPEHTDSVARANGYAHITDILLPKDYESQKTMVDLAFYDFDRRLPRSVVPMLVKSFYTESRAEQVQLIRYLEEHQSEFLSMDYAVEIPIQLHWGKHDPIIPLNTGKQLKEYYGEHAELIVYDSCNHVPNYENAVAFNRNMQRFLDSVK